MFKNITVIGSGLMGSAIAALFTNAGCKVNLLDIPSKNSKNRNFLADEALNKLSKTTPSPITLKSNLRNINTGNIEDDLEVINQSEWVIEAVLEDINIKKNIFKQIDTIMKDELIISSNTSTIPIKQLNEGRTKKFKNNFLITHFFNPPRYLRLLEIIISKETNNEIIKTIKNFCDIYLGKNVIETKDTAGFIGNRIGIFWIERSAVEAINQNLTVEEADNIIMHTFKVPKTGVFGLLDVVGLDLVPAVINSLLSNLPQNDYYHSLHQSPELFNFMIKNGMIGRKGDGGFYKLIKKNGKKTKHSLNLKSKKYYVSKKYQIEDIRILKKNLINFLQLDNKYSKFAFKVLSDVLFYVLTIAEEISFNIHSIDSAMRDGFNWKLGPFEIIDSIGINSFKELLINHNIKIPPLLDSVEKSFYIYENNEIKYYDFLTKKYKIFKRPNGVLLLSDIKKVQKPVRRITTASLWDIGDKIIVFEIHSKGNSIDSNTLEFLNQSIDLISISYRAMIIYNEGELFSAGANLAEALFLGNIGLESELDKNILSKGQEVYKKLKYSNFPVVSAPSGLALGGGCEIILHSDYIQAHSESYIGLTEAALGILPAWGGCKEILLKFLSNKKTPKGPMPSILKAFELIGMAKVSKSADEAKKLGYLNADDGITMNRNRLLYDAKMKAITLSKSYVTPKDVIFHLPGKTAFAALKLIINNMKSNGQISTYDQFIGENIAKVLSGGNTDITEELNEEYMLKLEKNAIYKLLKQNLTIERLEYVLATGKYLRN